MSCLESQSTKMASRVWLILILQAFYIALAWSGSMQMVSAAETTTEKAVSAVSKSSFVRRRLFTNPQKNLFVIPCFVDFQCAFLSPSSPMCCQTNSTFNGIPCLGFGSCVNLLNDPLHCGSCTNTCPSGGFYNCCLGMCLNTTFDNNNCGGCGIKCLTGGSNCCSGRCTNTLFNTSSCGGCGIKCPTEGSNTCCFGKCINSLSDSNNCGGCGIKCPNGSSCCSGKCIDTFFDKNNCGGCGLTVPFGGFYNCCFGLWANVLFDNNNCGGCGIKCPSGFSNSCCGGKCVGRDFSSFNNTNCGGCGAVCQTVYLPGLPQTPVKELCIQGLCTLL